MPAHHVDFSAEVRRVAGALGRAPTLAQVSDLNAMLQAVADFDPETNAVTLPDGEDLSALIKRETSRFDRPEPSTADVPPIGASIQAGNLTLGELVKRAHAAETAREVATWPNPWLQGRENRTRQAVITNTAPSLAAKMRAEAGAQK